MPEIAQEFLFDGGICAQRQSEPALWPSQASRLLNQAPAKSGEPFKVPEGRALFGRLTVGGSNLHLKLTIQGVRKYHCQQVGLVSQEFLDRNVIHLPFRFQLCKDRFLGSSTLMVGHDVPGGDSLVGDDHFELVRRRLWNEQIQLQWPFPLNSASRANDEKARSALPALRLPLQLEVGGLGVDAPPPLAGLDLFFQTVKALEGHRDRELHTDVLELPNDRVAEEGAIHTDFDDCSWKHAAHSVDALEDKLPRTTGVVHVAGSVQDIEDLTGLRDGAKQGIVTALTFLFAIEADRRALSMSAGAEHGAIEVERHARGLKGLQAVEDEVTSELLKPLDGLDTDRAKGSAESGNMRQALETEEPQDHRVIAVIGNFPQFSVSEKNVQNQCHKLKAATIGGVAGDVPKAGAKSSSEPELVEEDLEDHQAGEGAEFLVGELQVGKGTGFTLDLFSAKLHDGDLSWLVCAFWTSQIIPEKCRHYYISTRKK